MTLYKTLLGNDFTRLPDAMRRFHSPSGVIVWQGTAEVTRGCSILAGLACRLFGFPRTGHAVPLTLTITPENAGERWDRDFGGRVMTSFQFARNGLLIERLGPVEIHMTPAATERAFSVSPVSWSVMGIPLPKALIPMSRNAETEVDGVFQFDVSISAPLAGHIVSYRGYLEVKK
jgi:hypothetical protein